jgi:hypothetical protein
MVEQQKGDVSREDSIKEAAGDPPVRMVDQMTMKDDESKLREAGVATDLDEQIEAAIAAVATERDEEIDAAIQARQQVADENEQLRQQLRGLEQLKGSGRI